MFPLCRDVSFDELVAALLTNQSDALREDEQSTVSAARILTSRLAVLPSVTFSPFLFHSTLETYLLNTDFSRHFVLSQLYSLSFILLVFLSLHVEAARLAKDNVEEIVGSMIKM